MELLFCLLSATKDSRFSAVTKDEIPCLYCSVSILNQFEDTQGYLDWEVNVFQSLEVLCSVILYLLTEHLGLQELV